MINNVQLSPNFDLYELTRTDVRSLQERNLVMGVAKSATLHALAAMLEKGRALLGGHPWVVHSGFRCRELNQLIGGSPSSQHLLAEACDFHVIGVPLREAFERLHAAKEQIPYGQLILEGHNGTDYTWIHASLGAPWRDPSKCGETGLFDGRHYTWL